MNAPKGPQFYNEHTGDWQDTPVGPRENYVKTPLARMRAMVRNAVARQQDDVDPSTCEYVISMDGDTLTLYWIDDAQQYAHVPVGEFIVVPKGEVDYVSRYPQKSPIFSRNPAERHIVCISGSMRFAEQMQLAAAMETLRGHVVLMPHFVMDKHLILAGNNWSAGDIKMMLDSLHMDKIVMAHELLVVAPDGYTGESTQAEIKFAESIHRPVRIWR